MNLKRRPFRINIGFLINQPIGTLREIPFEFENYILENEFPVDDLHGTITLARTQNGIRALIDFFADSESECGRCLEPFKLKLHTNFEAIFTFENRPLSEDEEIIPEDGNIDFEPLIREYLMLEIPFKPICKPDCRGLCSLCGENLNEKDCGHTHPRHGSSHTHPSINSRQLLKS